MIPENTSKNTHNVVASLLLEDQVTRVLDIPSGAGAFTKRLLDKNVEVHSADIENIMQVENKNFREADMNKRLPYDDGFFDGVICIDGIEHLEQPFDFIRESQRILKPGGSIIISTPNINALRSRWRWFWTAHHNKDKAPLDEHKPTPLHHINMMSYQRLRYILHTNGMEITKVAVNRIKFVSWLYAVFVPFSYLFTSYVYHREEKNPLQRKANKQIIKHMFGVPLLFGETMIVKARKK
ncbi:MAG: class I SAM-dependent methyltransferase [Bacteroidota bacterium]